MWYARPQACRACSARKQKCLFTSSQARTCLGCEKRSLECSGQHGERRPYASHAHEAGALVTSSIGPDSLSWKLGSQELSASLSHHLISLHLKHRPAALYGGMRQFQWNGVGDLSANARARVIELDPVAQALVALGLADGARLSTHSAVIGSQKSPTPHFGTFYAADSHLTKLGRLRRDAVDCMNLRAMQFLDNAVLHKEDMSPGLMMQLLWLGVAVLVETPSMRSWCRNTTVRCAKLMLECMEREDLGKDERLTLNDRADFIVMFESMRSISSGVESPLSRHEYVTAIPYVTFPLPPVFHPSPQDFDLLLQPPSGIPDFVWIKSFVERLFTAGRLRLVKIAFLFLYGKVIVLQDLVNLTWDGMKEAYDMTDRFVDNVLSNPLYAEVDRSRGTARWGSWIALQLVLTHFVRAEHIFASLMVGAHLRLVASGDLGRDRKTFLAHSQKNCYLALRRMDFIVGTRDLVSNYQDFDPLVTTVRQIASMPEGGPCNEISLTDFPNLSNLMRFMAFSNAECSEFLDRHGPSQTSSRNGQIFLDGTSTLELPIRGNHLPPLPSSRLAVFDMNRLVSEALSPSLSSTVNLPYETASKIVLSALNTISDSPNPHEIAENLVQSTLASLSNEESTSSTKGTTVVVQTLEVEELSSKMVEQALKTLK